MKSITIHNLEDPLNKRIRERARQEGLSLNKTIKKLLAETLGLMDENTSAREDEFADLCGVWGRQDVQEFKQKTEELDSVDPEDWQ